MMEHFLKIISSHRTISVMQGIHVSITVISITNESRMFLSSIESYDRYYYLFRHHVEQRPTTVKRETFPHG